MSEIYTGVKFKVEFLKRKLPENNNIEELIKWCNKFANLDLAPPCPGGSAGNLSFRAKSHNNHFIITASGTALGNQLVRSDFVYIEDCNIESKTVKCSGEKNPSSETILHNMIYKVRPEVNAVFHGHYTNFFKIAEEQNIPITNKEEPYGSIALVDKVEEIIKNGNFLLMKNHGFLSLGENMAEAGNLTLDWLKKI